MNTKLEAALIISAGAMLAAGAHYGSELSANIASAFGTEPALAAAAETPARLAWTHVVPDDPIAARFLQCQDSVTIQNGSTNNASISTRDDRGGYKVSIVDGELEKIEAEGGYTLEEEGDTVRVLDPDGNVAFETSKSNPTIGDSGVFFGRFDSPLWNMAPQAPVERAALGVGTSDLSDAMATQLGIDTGVVVEFVEPGSGADAAGIRQYDVIVAIDGEATDATGLTRAITAHEPGDTVTVDLIRGGAKRSVEATLGATAALAPAFDRLGIDLGGMTDIGDIQRMIDAHLREMESLMQSLPSTGSFSAPTIRLRPGVTPNGAPNLSPNLAPVPAPPAASDQPDSTDASELAPKHRSRRAPA